MSDSPTWNELDAIIKGKSTMDLAEEIWRLRQRAEVDAPVKRACQQLQWIAMQEDKAKEFEERGEQRIPCFLQLEYVYESAKVYRELSQYMNKQP